MDMQYDMISATYHNSWPALPARQERTRVH